MILYRSSSMLHFYKLSSPPKLISKFSTSSLFLSKSAAPCSPYPLRLHFFWFKQSNGRPSRGFSTATAAVVDDKKGSNDTFYADEGVTWKSLGLSDRLARALENSRFGRPSLIQKIFFGTRNFIARSGLHPQSYVPSWKTNFRHLSIKSIELEYLLTRFRVQCFSSRKSSGAKTSRSRKSETEPLMDREKDEFFVVRKGDVVGVYKTLAECQAQVGSSICHPPVSVYKGYSLSKDTEEFLASHGLKNALYTIRAADLTEDLFGSLMPCPFQEPLSKKGPKDMRELQIEYSCIVEFDGASKGNPGPAGAGAVLRTNDGSLICKLCEGVGIATNNVAEYRGLILGLKYALEKGYTNIRVHGDSKLVCNQVLGSWSARHQDMSKLCGEAKKLKEKFVSFQITHVLRHLNSEADAQANLGIQLADGQVAEECML